MARAKRILIRKIEGDTITAGGMAFQRVRKAATDEFVCGPFRLSYLFDEDDPEWAVYGHDTEARGVTAESALGRLKSQLSVDLLKCSEEFSRRKVNLLQSKRRVNNLLRRLAGVDTIRDLQAEEETFTVCGLQFTRIADNKWSSGPEGVGQIILSYTPQHYSSWTAKLITSDPGYWAYQNSSGENAEAAMRALQAHLRREVRRATAAQTKAQNNLVRLKSLLTAVSPSA